MKELISKTGNLEFICNFPPRKPKLQMKLSVILPFYNAENTIARAVDSILKQTFTDFELILVDNNSTDKSLSIVQEIALANSRIVIFREGQQGVSYACNRGLSLAIGELLARMDADDVSLPERLEKQVKFLDENPHIGVVATKVKHISAFPSEGMVRFVDWSNTLISSKQIAINAFVEQPVITPSLMWRRSVMPTADLFCHNNDVPEDYDAILNWLNNGVAIAKLPETLHHWHDSESRLTRTNERYTQDAFNRVKMAYLMDWLKKNVTENRKISMWGSGKMSRKRSDLLIEMGLEIDSFIDLKENKQKSPPVLFYKNITAFSQNFILCNVSAWNAREQIHDFLVANGFSAGKDFLHIG